MPTKTMYIMLEVKPVSPMHLYTSTVAAWRPVTVGIAGASRHSHHTHELLPVHENDFNIGACSTLVTIGGTIKINVSSPKILFLRKGKNIHTDITIFAHVKDYSKKRMYMFARGWAIVPKKWYISDDPVPLPWLLAFNKSTARSKRGRDLISDWF